MSTNTMLPALDYSRTAAEGLVLPMRSSPGLGAPAIDTLRPTFPGTLTSAHKELLRQTCGLDGTPLGYVDFTGQWHDEEALAVFRPCLTLAVDAQGRRWIAETARTQGLPGPVWCILPDPQVVVYISDDLGEFLEMLRRYSCENSAAAWLQAVDTAARRAWTNRGALTFQSRQTCGHDRHVRAWLLQLPRDSRVYDLRSPTFGTGWPYGVAGGGGRYHRCGRELLFAVSGFPAPRRWADYLGELAQHHEPPAPAVIAYARRGSALTAPRQEVASHQELRSCA